MDENWSNDESDDEFDEDDFDDEEFDFTESNDDDIPF